MALGLPSLHEGAACSTLITVTTETLFASWVCEVSAVATKANDSKPGPRKFEGFRPPQGQTAPRRRSQMSSLALAHLGSSRLNGRSGMAEFERTRHVRCPPRTRNEQNTDDFDQQATRGAIGHWPSWQFSQNHLLEKLRP